MDKKARAHVYISGTVQGVFFRDNARKKAEELGVFGFIRNLADGRVEAVFEGEEGRVQALIDWCRQGPAGANVDNVELVWEDYTSEFQDFTAQ